MPPSSLSLLVPGCALGLAALVAVGACSSDDEPAGGPEPVPTTNPTTTNPTTNPTTPPPRFEPTGPCGAGLPTDPEPEAAIHTPRWAFEPWISKDISDGPDTYAFVDGFQQRGIPVGVVVLDSPWETSYNSLIPNPNRYPEFGKMVSDLRAKNVRTVLWLTAMINYSSFDVEAGGDFYKGPASNYDEASTCGFFVNEGVDSNWWKGKGSSLDFFNPAATAWWHWQLDKLLIDQGVAGFKLDFGENYLKRKGGKKGDNQGTIATIKGDVPFQEYSESYYHDFYRHGVAVRGPDEFVTMVRPYDASYEFQGRFFARPEHAPTSWVGDNRRDWFGFNDALDHIFRSAAKGYVVVGSDIGGYLNVDDQDLLTKIEADSEVFLRWTAVGALTPFMQLHGRANVTPWTIEGRSEQETVAAWRYWGTLHHELIPFFYSLAEQAYTAGGQPILRPEGALESWAGDYRFSLGEAFFAAPLVAPGNKRDVALPAGRSYIDWWTGQEIAGGTTVSVDMPDASRIPLYLKQGAIVPLDVSDDVTRLGDASSKDSLTVLVYPGPTTSRFVVHEDDRSTYGIEASAPAAGSATIKVERAPRPALLRVQGAFGSVKVDGQALSESTGLAALNGQPTGFWRDGAVTWVRLPAGTTARSVEATP